MDTANFLEVLSIIYNNNKTYLDKKTDKELALIRNKKNNSACIYDEIIDISKNILYERYPQLENYIFNNDTLKEAVKFYIDNEEKGIEKYGPINLWDTSQVTDMSNLFKYYVFPTFELPTIRI